MESEENTPDTTPTCVSESFGNLDEIPDENRLTKQDVEKYLVPKRQVSIDTANLPFKYEDNHTGLDKKFPMYISKVLEFYEQGGRYKEFRNILKKQKRKEEKARNSPMPPLLGCQMKDGNFLITFE